MHTCILLHGLRTSWHSCPRRMNAGNKNTPSMHLCGWIKKKVAYTTILFLDPQPLQVFTTQLRGSSLCWVLLQEKHGFLIFVHKGCSAALDGGCDLDLLFYRCRDGDEEARSHHEAYAVHLCGRWQVEHQDCHHLQVVRAQLYSQWTISRDHNRWEKCHGEREGGKEKGEGEEVGDGGWGWGG